MFKKMVTLADLDRLDGGSFNRMVEEARKIGSNESEVLDMVARRVVQGVKDRILKEKVAHFMTQFIDFGDIPRRKRSSLDSRKAKNVAVKQNQEQEVVSKKRKFSQCFEEKVAKKMKKGQPKKLNLNAMPKWNSFYYNIKFAELGLDSNFDLPSEYVRNLVEKKLGKILILVITKEVTATDLKDRQCRFSMPLSKIRPGFLKPEEKAKLDNYEVLHCTLIQPYLDETLICIKKWDMNNSISYNLISGWKSVLKNNEKNGLKEKDVVQVWSFRCNDGKLWLLLVKIGMDAASAAAAGSSSGKVCMEDDMVSSRHGTITIQEQD